MPDVVGYGGAVMDLSLNINEMPAPNKRGNLNALSWQYGGTVPNGLVAVRIMSGHSCGLVGVYGGTVGKYVLGDLKRHGVDLSQMVESPVGSSRLTVVISVKKDSSRNFFGLPSDMRDLEPDDVDTSYLEGAKYVYVHRANPAQIKAAKAAHEKGIKVVMDADMGTPAIRELLPYVDFMIASEKCYGDLFRGEGDYRANLEKMRAMCSPGALSMVTLGERGLVGMDGDGFFEQPAFLGLETVDTAGCGDIFHGAFIAGLLRGMDNRTCARYAQAAAAIKSTRIGARAGIGTHEVVMGFLETGAIDYTGIDERVAYYANMPML
ncbi:MAG: PfkB family carbohydrate kinase [Lachnospiraceae bacterium]|jgi:sugar/nucleoside kinase (ribokinase family)|nr:PfkB family carbohydrate kinase [Lachnospiraceae bacterium]